MDPTTINIINQGLDQIHQALDNDLDQIRHLGLVLAFWLTVIQVTVIGFYISLRDGLFDGLIKAIQSMLVIGVFITFIVYGGGWISTIINGFIDGGASASGVPSISPSAIVDQGLSICAGMLKNFTTLAVITKPFMALLAAAVTIGILVLYALIAANAAIALVKSYCLVTLSGIMFAFGTNELTRPIAMNYIKAVLGIGLYLLVLYLLLGVGVSLGQHWAELIKVSMDNSDVMPIFVIFGAVIIFYMIISNVPQFIAGLSGVGGFQNYGGAAVGAAITAGTTGARLLGGGTALAATGLKGAAQSAAVLGNAAKAAKTSIQTGGSSVLGGIGSAAATTGKAVLGATKDTLMNNQPGLSLGQKVNQRMKQEIAKKAALKAHHSPPKPRS